MKQSVDNIMSVQVEMKENDETMPTDLGEMSRRKCVVVWKMLLFMLVKSW